MPGTGPPNRVRALKRWGFSWNAEKEKYLSLPLLEGFEYAPVGPGLLIQEHRNNEGHSHHCFLQDLHLLGDPAVRG